MYDQWEWRSYVRADQRPSSSFKLVSLSPGAHVEEPTSDKQTRTTRMNLRLLLSIALALVIGCGGGDLGGGTADSGSDSSPDTSSTADDADTDGADTDDADTDDADTDIADADVPDTEINTGDVGDAPDAGDSGALRCATDLAGQFESRAHPLTVNAQQDQTVPVIVAPAHDGSFWVAWTDSPWSEGSLLAHIQQVGADLEFTGTRLDIPGSMVVGMHAHADGTLAVAHGRRTGPEPADPEWRGAPRGTTPNTLFLSRFDGEEERFRTQVRGGEGYTSSPESTWLLPDGTGASVSVAFNGNRYALFYVIGRHFESGEVHQADEYVELDRDGAIVESTRAGWLNSHSFWPSAVAVEDRFYTLTVADPFPQWGLRLGGYVGGAAEGFTIVWPSADIADEVTSRGPVGRAGAIFSVDGKLATVMRTWVDRESPAATGSQHRAALLTFEINGSLAGYAELSPAPGPENDRVAGGARFGDAVLTIVSDVGNASIFGGAPVTLQMLDAEGATLAGPTSVDARYAWSSDPVTLSDGSVVWGAVRENVSQTLQLFRVACAP